MIFDYPLTGVGLGNFLVAFPDYSDEKPIVCHNTLFQIGSENGLIALIMYLLICSNLVKDCLKLKKSQKSSENRLLKYSNDAILCSFFGFFVCSFFLNLATYELLYYLICLNTVKNKLFYDDK